VDYNDIRRLVKLVESSDISELEIAESENSKVRIVKHHPPVAGGVQVAQPQYYQAPAPLQMPHSVVPTTEYSTTGTTPVAAKPAVTLLEVLSPMVGTFYASPAPDRPPYAKVGDSIRVGQVLCIIEAMKLMNEIESEIAGRLVEIVAQNAHPVEFGQVLFRIDPNA